MLSPCIRYHHRNRHNKKNFVKHYLVIFFLFITSHLRPSLVCPLRVYLNLGEAMTPWILLFQMLKCPECPILVDIAEDFIQDFQDDYGTSHQFHNLFWGKVYFLRTKLWYICSML